MLLTDVQPYDGDVLHLSILTKTSHKTILGQTCFKLDQESWEVLLKSCVNLFPPGALNLEQDSWLRTFSRLDQVMLKNLVIFVSCRNQDSWSNLEQAWSRFAQEPGLLYSEEVKILAAILDKSWQWKYVVKLQCLFLQICSKFVHFKLLGLFYIRKLIKKLFLIFIIFLFDCQCIYFICKIITWLKIIFSMSKKSKEY